MLSEHRQKAFSVEISEGINILEANQFLAVTGISNAGGRNLVKLIYQKIESQFELAFYDDNFLTIEEILTKTKNATGKILIAMPNFSLRDIEFQKNIQRLLQGSTKEIYTLINITLNDYLNRDSLFQISSKLISHTLFLKPRNKQQLALLLQDHCSEELSKALTDEIYELSGGIPGLMKACINFYKIKTSLEISALLQNPYVEIALSQVKSQYEALNNQQLNEFGIIDAKGNIISKLIEEYLKNNLLQKESLVEKLIKLFIKNKANLISIDSIDQFIADNGEFSLWNRYKLIERVRDKLPVNYKLITVRNKGYKLVNG